MDTHACLQEELIGLTVLVQARHNTHMVHQPNVLLRVMPWTIIRVPRIIDVTGLGVVRDYL